MARRNLTGNATVDLVIAQIKDTKLHFENLTRHGERFASLMRNEGFDVRQKFEVNLESIKDGLRSVESTLFNRWEQTPDYPLFLILVVAAIFCILLVVLIASGHCVLKIHGRYKRNRQTRANSVRDEEVGGYARIRRSNSSNKRNKKDEGRNLIGKEAQV